MLIYCSACLSRKAFRHLWSKRPKRQDRFTPVRDSGAPPISTSYLDRETLCSGITLSKQVSSTKQNRETTESAATRPDSDYHSKATARGSCLQLWRYSENTKILRGRFQKMDLNYGKLIFYRRMRQLRQCKSLSTTICKILSLLRRKL